MVILEGVFDADAIVGLGKAAIADLEWALTAAAERLKLAKDTSTSGKVEKHHEEIVYEELACRQEGRFEVRGGAALASALGARESLEGQRPGKLVLPLQTHPGILSLLQVACGAPGHQLSASEPGDTVIARDVGAFVSLPGAKDQRLHADNDHLFWHTTLPPHVVTMFLPGLTLLGDKTPHPPGAANSASATDDGDDGDEAADSAKVGWTTFIPGTHTVEGAAKVLADPEASIPQRSLSPHLTAGDVLLYDARLLHFGLANKSKHTKRPLLYASFVRSWFQDQQNWGTESLKGLH